MRGYRRAKTGGPALRQTRPDLLRLPLRLALVGAVLAGSFWVVQHRLAEFNEAAVLAALGQLGLWQVVVALVAVATAFAAVAGQERAVVAHLGLVLPPGRAATTAAAAAAVSQTVGFGPIVGALVRRRLMREVTLGQSFAISAGITLGFFAGLGLLVLTAFAVLPGLPHRVLAQVGVLMVLAVAATLALSRRPTFLGLRKPNLFIIARFLFWLCLDLAALATALWALLPGSAAPDFGHFLPVFLIALGLGVASGSPGGIGPFEAALLAHLPQVPAAELLAAIVTYRALAYALPSLCGAVWLLLRPGPAVTGGAVGVTDRQHLSPEALQRLPDAEAQLIRQGNLTMSSLNDGVMWVSGKLSHTRVMLGPLRPLAGDMDRPLAAVERLARTEARMLCLYKIDARTAAAARRRGYAVLPVAREAVLDPGGFHLGGPDRARLRRKLAHACKAGVAVRSDPTPPLTEMEAVARVWAQGHGRERGFSMGRWDRTYAAGQRVVTARDATGRLVAFITFHTCSRQWVLDLVRLRPEAPDGTIYAMILHAVELARWHEVAEVSLASVPEADFGLSGPLARVMRRATSGSVGLAQFKSTFAPGWRPLYIAAPSRLALLIGAVDVARAVLWPAPLARGRGALIVLDRAGAAPAQVPDLGSERAA